MTPSPAALRSRLRGFDRALRLPGLLWVDSRADTSIPDDIFAPETDEERDARVLIEERRKANARRRISYAWSPRREPVEFDSDTFEWHTNGRRILRSLNLSTRMLPREYRPPRVPVYCEDCGGLMPSECDGECQK